jgi:hypothetical protein
VRIISGNGGRSSAVLLADTIADNPSVLNILLALTHHEQRKAYDLYSNYYVLIDYLNLIQ